VAGNPEVYEDKGDVEPEVVSELAPCAKEQEPRMSLSKSVRRGVVGLLARLREPTARLAKDSVAR
jgi:hypothetical protein